MSGQPSLPCVLRRRGVRSPVGVDMNDGRSLIQQRIAISRRRTIGLVIVVVAALFLGVEAVLLLTGPPDGAFRWFTSVVMVGWLAGGISQLVVARRRRKSFEAEHGPDAGMQRPVGR